MMDAYTMPHSIHAILAPPLIVGVATPDTNTTTPQLLSCIAMITARAHHTAAASIRNPPAPATTVTSPMIT